MRKVTKTEFEEFIKNYKGSEELYSRDIGFTTPRSTMYWDFGLNPGRGTELERLSICLVAEHVYPNVYDKESVDKYYIYVN